MTTPVQGVDSGFMPVAAGATSLPQWTITVQNASAPLWFFCAQTGYVIIISRLVFAALTDSCVVQSLCSWDGVRC